MKFNVTVDLEDLYDEYGGEDGSPSFNEQILDEINRRLKNEIWTAFRKDTHDEFKAKIERELKEGKDSELERIIRKVFSEKKIKKRDATSKSTEEMVTLFEYIEESLTNYYFNENSTAEKILDRKIREFEVKFEKAIGTYADKIGNELKDRYDLLFASQLVAKMNEVGLLKTDVANLLLPKTEE